MMLCVCEERESVDEWVADDDRGGWGGMDRAEACRALITIRQGAGGNRCQEAGRMR